MRSMIFLCMMSGVLSDKTCALCRWAFANPKRAPPPPSGDMVTMLETFSGKS